MTMDTTPRVAAPAAPVGSLTPTERRTRIAALKGELDALYATCTHATTEVQHARASCAGCGKDMGWYCPVGPKGYCEYRTSEYCRWCGEPEERK